MTANGRIIEEISYDSDDNGIYRYKYTYDKNGKLTDCIIYDEDDGSIYKRSEYQYDENGYKTEVTTYNISDEVIGHFEYKYTGATEEQYLNDMKNFEEDN